MSRHELTPKAGYEQYTITVGWDRPLGSFFAQVLNLDLEECSTTSRTQAR